MISYRRALFVSGVFLFAAATATPLAAAAAQLGIGQVVITAADYPAEEPIIFRAFVPTLSSAQCLITLAETNFPTPGTTTFCGVRVMNGVPGVVISIFMPEVPPADTIWIVNVYQDRARGYGSPVAFVPE